MGVLTEIIIADIEESSVILDSLDRQSWPNLDLQGHGTETLAALWEIINPEIDAEEAEDSFELLTGDNDHGPWVFRIPEAFANLLSECDNDRINQIHQAWSQHPEIEADLFDDEDRDLLKANLTELVDLIRKRDDKPVLMWLCL